MIQHSFPTRRSSDQPLLDEVFSVTAGEEVGARLQANETCVATDQRIHRLVVSIPRPHDQLKIRELPLGPLGRIRSRGWSGGHVGWGRSDPDGRRASAEPVSLST